MENEVKYYPYKLNNILIIKQIMTIHYQEIDKDYVYEGESHPFWEIMYADKNKVLYHLDKEEFVLKEKQVVCIKPNTFHSIRCDKGTNILIISFECKSPCMSYFENKQFTLSDEFIEMLSIIINEAKNTFVLPKFDPSLKKMELIENPLLGGEQLIQNYLEAFFIKLIREEAAKAKSSIVFYSKKESDLSFEEQIIKYLTENIYNHITLDDVCNEVGYCKTHLCKLFKEKMNVSVMDYYMSLKIQEAKVLLKKGVNIKDVSESLNFNNTSHFSNTFKHYTTYTPKKYKESLIK